jgi:hypothetical protein
MSEREMARAKYILVNRFALQDQRAYYERTRDRHRTAASQVNFLRASCALLTILVTAVATYIVQTRFVDVAGACTAIPLAEAVGECADWRTVTNVLMALSVLFPALGAFFNMLADLFQWDRLSQIYTEAADSLNVPDALSPDDAMPDVEYRASLLAFASGTLGVMRDESAQWGQLIRTPSDIEAFRQQALETFTRLERDKLGSHAPGLTNTAGDGISPAPPTPTLPAGGD